MIANHSDFIEAIGERKKVRISFYSQADEGVLDHVCAPIDYGRAGGNADGKNRYWFWDYTPNMIRRATGLLAEQILEFHVLHDDFAPNEIGVQPWVFDVARDWGSPSS
jgi:hypothetical protein